MFGLGFYPFSGLVCDLLLRSRRVVSPKANCQKSNSFHKRDVQCLEDTGVSWCLSYTLVGHHFLGATFLGSWGDLIMGGHVSAFSYMVRQTNNSGLLAILYMVRQAKSGKLLCLGTQDK